MNRHSNRVVSAHAGTTVFLTGAILLLAAASATLAQPFPSKPVRFILGPSSEVLPRVIAQRLSAMWGHQVLVDPRTGGGGIIAAETVRNAPPDGHTWLLTTATNTISASTLANPPYDIARDFLPVTQLASAPFYLLLHPSLPVKSVQEFIAFARARPGQLNYGSGGVGTPTHLTAEMLKSMTKLNIVHVSYKSSAASTVDHIAGHLQVCFQYGPTSLPHVKSGRLRGLAVTSPVRSRFAPELPTMIEAGVPGYIATGWNGVHVPLRTPVDILNKLNADLRRALQAPEVQERLTAAGLDVQGSTREEFEKFVNADRARWAKVVKDAGITPE